MLGSSSLKNSRTKWVRTKPVRTDDVSGTSTHPLGRNWFFQPGLGPGFFRTRGSSEVFGFCLLRVLLSLEVLEESQNLSSTVNQHQESRT